MPNGTIGGWAEKMATARTNRGPSRSITLPAPLIPRSTVSTRIDYRRAPVGYRRVCENWGMVWEPSREFIERTNVWRFMQRLGFRDREAFLHFSREEPERFW